MCARIGSKNYSRSDALALSWKKTVPFVSDGNSSRHFDPIKAHSVVRRRDPVLIDVSKLDMRAPHVRKSTAVEWFVTTWIQLSTSNSIQHELIEHKASEGSAFPSTPLGS